MVETKTLVDAHVHVHPGFDPDTLLSSAYRNFSHHAQACGAEECGWSGVLMLAETSACDWFSRTRSQPEAVNTRSWRLQPLPDDEVSLLATGSGGQSLHVLAGRQVNTCEGLEVLTLASNVHVPDGIGLDDTLRMALESGAVVVLPWGVGKWLGRRGRLVARALGDWGDMVFTGDNGGRPRSWPRPALFAASESLGKPVLPGSDPLPLPGQERRVGDYGFMIGGRLSELRPGLELRGRLIDLPVQALQAFGRPETLTGFVSSQIRLRLA